MRHLLLLCSALSLICSSSSAQVWQALNGGLKYSPVAVTEVDKTIAVAYKVSEKDASVVFGISIWNGTIWTHLPTIVCDSGARINTLKWYKKALYIGGQFNRFNKITNAHSLVRYMNREYVDVPSLNTNSVKYFETIIELSIYNDLLTVAGQFASTVVKNSGNIGFFNGEKWVESGIKELENVNGGVLTSVGSGDHFYIGGVFTGIGATRSKYIAHFEKGELIPFTYNYARPYHLITYNKGTVAAGTINANETPMYFFEIDGDTAKKMMNGLDHVTYVSDIVAAGDVLYASGLFKFSTDQTVYSIVKFENGKWSPLAVGQLENVKRLLFHNDVLVAIGDFKEYRGITLNHVAILTTKMKYAIVSGTVYHDKDNNCKFNGRDEKLSENLIRIQPGNRVLRPNVDGQYKIYLEEGNYTITVTPSKYWDAASCGSLVQSVLVKPGDVKDDVDFPLSQQSNIRDLSVKILASSGPRAVANNVQQYYINYENLGSSELVEGIVKLVFDPDLEKMISSPLPQKVEGDTAYWTVSDLSPGEKGVIKCRFYIKKDASGFINLSSNIIQNDAETDDENNSSSLTQLILTEDYEVRKFVNPETTWTDTSFINPDAKSITYQITFANYTADTVRTVYVIDTVDLNNTIWEITDISWSHPVISTTIEGPKYSDYSTLIYKFENINLPPNPTMNGEVVNDEGHVAFEMKLNSNLQIGMAFSNRARVYYDYEFEYDTMTNEVVAMVEENASVSVTPSYQSTLVYPNPADNSITIALKESNSNAPFSITSITGTDMLNGNLLNDNSIDVSNLIPGVYFVQVSTDAGLYTAKMIKQ